VSDCKVRVCGTPPKRVREADKDHPATVDLMTQLNPSDWISIPDVLRTLTDGRRVQEGE
jgi:hypothetical protein